MVLFEKQLERKTELLAKCEMCECCVPSARDCYVNHARLTFLCLQCYEDIPSEAETERMVEKLRAYQTLWAAKKIAYESFINIAKEVNLSDKTPESVCLEGLTVADVQGN